MKRFFFLALITLLSCNTYSQKKIRGEAQRSGAKPIATSVLAKVDNLLVEVKKGNFQLTINENGKEKDAIIIKPADANFKPTNCKLTVVTASGTKLYLLSWTEVTQQKTDLKTEDTTTNYSVIYEIASKKQVFSNSQSNTHIVEKVFLDKNKTASETREKIRKDGFEFVLNPDGTVTQKGKKQDIKWVYDAVKIEYVVKK